MKSILLLFLGVGLFVVGYVLRIGPGGGGTLASLKLPDGSEYRVSQRYNWSPEPYNVSFYTRTGPGPWTWHYIDHQAFRWRDVKMSYDTPTDSILVTEAGVPRIRLDRHRKTLWFDNGQFSREETMAALDPATPQRPVPVREAP